MPRQLRVKGQEEWDEADAERAIAEDFASDAKGADTLSRELFMEAFFELADVWTESTDAAEYVRFLRNLLEKLTAVGADGRRVFVADDDIEVGVGQPEALEQMVADEAARLGLDEDAVVGGAEGCPGGEEVGQPHGCPVAASAAAFAVAARHGCVPARPHAPANGRASRLGPSISIPAAKTDRFLLLIFA